MATTSPNVTPKAPRPGMPMVRTAKSSWSGYTSTCTGPGSFIWYFLLVGRDGPLQLGSKYGRSSSASFVFSLMMVLSS